jgi:hypothetical protein
MLHVLTGACGDAVVEALHYKLEGRGIDSLWTLEFFIDIILLAAQKRVPGIFPGVKVAGV